MNLGRWVGAALLLALTTQLAAAELVDCLGLVPRNSLVVIVVKDLNQAHRNVSALAAKLSEGAEIPDLWDAWLDMLQIKAQVVQTKPDGTQALVDLPTTIDRSRPLMLVIPEPGQVRKLDDMDVVMLPVTKYGEFLNEIARIKSTAEDVRKPQQTPDGFDMIEGDPQTLYFIHRGEYAAGATSPEALKNFQKDTHTVLESLTPESRKLFAENDAYAYLNYAQAMTTFKTDLAKLPEMWKAVVKDAVLPPGMDVDRMTRFLQGLADTVIELGEQLDAGEAGLKVSADGVWLTVLNRARPETMLGRFVAAQKPGILSLLRIMDADVPLAGDFYIAPGSTKGLYELGLRFVQGAGLLPEPGKMAEFRETEMGLAGQLKGQMAFAVTPLTDAVQEDLCFTELFEVEDASRAKRLSLTENLLLVPAMCRVAGIEIKATEQKDVEPGIDRLSLDPADPDAAKGRRDFLAQTYGTGTVYHFGAVGDRYVVSSIDDPGPGSVKRVVADLAADKTGTLLGSQGFARATAGLPKERSGVLYVNVPRLLEVISRIPDEADEGFPLIPALDPAKASGVGMTFVFSGSTVRFDLCVPTTEMLNVKQMMMEAIGNARGRMGGPLPAPPPGADDF